MRTRNRTANAGCPSGQRIVVAERAVAALPDSAHRHTLRDVLADIASSLRAWLASELSPGTGIGFDPPSALARIERRPSGAGLVNLFLYAVAEDLEGLAGARVRVVDAEGRVAGTVSPVRTYQLSYLVTAWAADTNEEFELLGAVLGAHAERDSLSGEHLRGALVHLDTALPMRMGWSPSPHAPDVWSAIGTPMRTNLVLTVSAPALPQRVRQVAPPVRTRELDVHDLTRSADAAQPPPAIPRRRQRPTVVEH
ncbi:Pvc16 family protein [Actinophytocola sp. NPDC049390]|uniref:Pvc16 family protein n=1 Tax=Actinophytocola sp. NPDC049390 TaxID=3363894 RepID=UPI00379CF309